VCGSNLKVPGHGLITPHNTIVGWKRKFEDSGCVTNLMAGAPTTANIEEQGDNRRETMQYSPHLSGRQIYHALSVCRRSLKRTFQNIDLLFIIYKYVCVYIHIYFTYIYIYIYIYIYTHTGVCVCVCACACVPTTRCICFCFISYCNKIVIHLIIASHLT